MEGYFLEGGKFWILQQLAQGNSEINETHISLEAPGSTLLD